MILAYYENSSATESHFEIARRVAFGEEPEQWRARVTRYGALRLPFPFATFENPEFLGRVQSRQITAAARRYQLDRSLVFAGPTGCGKSTLTAAMLRRIAATEVASTLAGPVGAEPSLLLRQLAGLVWVDGFTLVKARKEHPLGRGEAGLIERAFEAPILVLDELGFEPLSEVVFEVADRRYRDGAITIVTTGQTPAGFAARYGDACWRRFAERGAVVSEWPAELQGTG